MAIILLSVVIICSSWGFFVHKTTHQLAIYQLPQPLRDYFYKNIDYLEFNAVRPDVRIKKDRTEGPKHYINLERYGSIAAMPQHWNDAVKKYSKDTLFKYGYLPYWIIEIQRRLTVAFKQENTDSILFYAADLGHYIEDANVPLHTTLNYDGQLTDQKGLHALWESTIPEINKKYYNFFSPHKATYIKNKEVIVWAAIQKAHAILPAIFAKEEAITSHFTDAEKYRVQYRKGKEVKTYSTAFAKAYATALGNTINQQLIISSNMVADFWYTAWVDAGKPDISKFSKSSLNDVEKMQLNKEMESFKNNRLINDGYLRAAKK
ncbi:hypothetical protein BH11BAC6_BH11BAC6_06060 [soil metagenome]